VGALARTHRNKTQPSRQSRSDRSHFAAPLTGLTEGQRRLRRSDYCATRQSEADRQPGPASGTIGNSASPNPGLGLGLSPGRRRTLLRPTQGSDSGSAPEDGELRSARPRARTRAQPRKTANFAPPNPGLGLGLSPGRRRTPLRPTQGSDLSSAPEDGELRSARPRARTRAQPRKTANSTPPDPRARTRAQHLKTTNSASPDPRARTQPWPPPTVSTSPDPGARIRPRPRKTDLTSTSEEPPRRPT
jgi:hypothetical protein